MEAVQADSSPRAAWARARQECRSAACAGVITSRVPARALSTSIRASCGLPRLADCSAMRLRMWAPSAWAGHGADWVLHGDADEFWWTRHADLKAAFARVPGEMVAVPVPRSNFLLSAEEAGRWWERLTVREVSGLNWQGRRLHPKLCHRGQAGVVVDHGAMGLSGPDTDRVGELPGVEILHVPSRTRRQ